MATLPRLFRLQGRRSADHRQQGKRDLDGVLEMLFPLRRARGETMGLGLLLGPSFRVDDIDGVRGQLRWPHVEKHDRFDGELIDEGGDELRSHHPPGDARRVDENERCRRDAMDLRRGQNQRQPKASRVERAQGFDRTHHPASVDAMGERHGTGRSTNGSARIGAQKLEVDTAGEELVRELIPPHPLAAFGAPENEGRALLLCKAFRDAHPRAPRGAGTSWKPIPVLRSSAIRGNVAARAAGDQAAREAVVLQKSFTPGLSPRWSNLISFLWEYPFNRTNW